jgi:hypothetical protein
MFMTLNVMLSMHHRLILLGSLDEDTCLWEAPVAHPNDGLMYYTWDESTLTWIEVTE